MAKIAIFTGCLLLLSGCAYMDIVGAKGAEISDGALKAAIWEMCNASPVGAVKRRFNTPEIIEAYNQICSDQSTLEVD